MENISEVCQDYFDGMFSISDCHFVKKWNILGEQPDFEKLVVKHWNKEHVSGRDAVMASVETILK